jgi:hypothetical protein
MPSSSKDAEPASDSEAEAEAEAEVAVKTSAPHVPDLRGMTARAALRAAEQAGLELAIAGSGVVVAQKPAAGSPLGALADGAKLRVTLAPHADARPSAVVAQAGAATASGGAP